MKDFFWPKGLNLRFKVFLGSAAVGLLIVAASFGWLWWKAQPERLGEAASWKTQETTVNNMSFRYPDSAFDLIIPESQDKNPFSLVKKGEKGETVLIQIGTWRGESSFSGLDDAANRYRNGNKDRTTLSEKKVHIDGREGILFTQDEKGGRRIEELLVWDPTDSSGSKGEVREISLQLSKSATQEQRALYHNVFQRIVQSIRFLNDLRVNKDQPGDIPLGWKNFESTDSGFSLWYPSDWVEGGSKLSADYPAWIQGPPGTTTYVFKPKSSGDNPDATEYIVQAFPNDQQKTIDELNTSYAHLFRQGALAGTKREELVGIPGVGGGVSLEAREKIGSSGKDFLSYLLTLAVVPLNDQGNPKSVSIEGRVYLIAALFSDGPDQSYYTETVQRITKSFRVL